MRIEQLRSFKRSEDAKAFTLTVKSLISRSREEEKHKVSSASGAVLCSGSSELGFPSNGHVWLHPTTDACSSARDDGELGGGGEKEEWVLMGIGMFDASLSRP